MKVLIDADSLYFRPACRVNNPIELRKAINYTLSSIEGQCWSDDFMIAVKGKGNFRKDFAPDYKTNRPALDPKVADMLSYGIEYLVSQHGAIAADGMEADDLCAIWANDCREFGTEHVVVGIDKDLLQIPGNHYNFVKETHTFMDPDEANMQLMLQCLTGDRTDNIPGLKGIGPVKAKKILAGVPMDRRWNRIKAAWRGHKSGSPDTSWRLLKMLETWEEYEDVKQQIADRQGERNDNARLPSKR